MAPRINRFHVILVGLLIAFCLFDFVFEWRIVTTGSKSPAKDRSSVSSSYSTSVGGDSGVEKDSFVMNGKDAPLFGLVTAFSSNHLYEGVSMLQSLRSVNFTAPFTIYLMREPNETLSEEMMLLKEEVKKTTLQPTFVEFEVKLLPWKTYCFKPSVIQHYLANNRPKVFMWADTSTRFYDNPLPHAQHMLRDNVPFAGRTGVRQRAMGMGENTHPDTYRYFSLNRTIFRNETEVIASHFIINLMNERVVHRILQPWLDCGVNACYRCMAPPGSSKGRIQRRQIRGPPSMQVICHRQDQSVLGILVYRWLRIDGEEGELQEQNKNLGPAAYLNVYIKRRGASASSLQDVWKR